MKNLVIALLTIVGLSACKKESKKDNSENKVEVNKVAETKKEVAFNKCDDILALYDEGLVIYEKEIIKYCDAYKKYAEKNNIKVEKLFMTPSAPKELSGAEEKMDAAFKDFAKKINSEKIISLHEECKNDEGFKAMVSERIENSKKKTISKLPKEFTPIVSAVLDTYKSEGLFSMAR